MLTKAYSIFRDHSIRSIGCDYPVLHQILGDEDFLTLARAYIEATPSTHRNARFYARDLPDFLRGCAPSAETRSLADLAAFERALADAFDAADVTLLDSTALAAVALQEQAQVRLTMSPGVAILNVVQGTTACYAAAIEGVDVAIAENDGQETVLVWPSPALEPHYRRLDEDEAMALGAAVQGGNLAELCCPLGLCHGPEAAPQLMGAYLSRWFADGLVSGLSGS